MKSLYAAAFAVLASSVSLADESRSELPIAERSYVIPIQQPSLNSPKAIRARMRNDQITAIVMQQRATGEYRARPTLHLPLAAVYPPPIVRYYYLQPRVAYQGY